MMAFPEGKARYYVALITAMAFEPCTNSYCQYYYTEQDADKISKNFHHCIPCQHHYHHEDRQYCTADPLEDSHV